METGRTKREQRRKIGERYREDRVENERRKRGDGARLEEGSVEDRETAGRRKGEQRGNKERM